MWWIRNTPANPNQIYVSLQNYRFQHRLFRNNAISHPSPAVVMASWEEIPHPRRAPLEAHDPDREPILTSIAFDSENENTIYIAYNGSQAFDGIDFLGEYAERMVFRMDISDIGQYPTTGKFTCGQYPCADITMNLPNTVMGQDGLVYEQGSNGGLYISTEAGVYFTNNKRITDFDPAAPQDADDMDNITGWVRHGDALPHTPTRGMEINYVINRVRVGTNGRGVWEHHLHCPDELDYLETGTYSSDDYLEAMNSISSEAVLPNNLKLNYRAGELVHLTPGFHAEAGASFHAFIHPCDIPGNSFLAKNLPLAEPHEDQKESVQTAHLKLYPNPASGFFTIETDFLTENGSGTMRMYGPAGDLVQQSSLKGAIHDIDASGMKGLYFVVVEGNGIQKTGKINLQ